jgi:hypothetical protein
MSGALAKYWIECPCCGKSTSQCCSKSVARRQWRVMAALDIKERAVKSPNPRSPKLPTLEEFASECYKHGMVEWQARLFYEWVCQQLRAGA